MCGYLFLLTCVNLYDEEMISMILGVIHRKKKKSTCIAWYTEQCSYGDENGVSQHHSNMDQDVEHCKTFGEVENYKWIRAETISKNTN